MNCNVVTLGCNRTSVLLEIIARDRAERHRRDTPVNPKVATLSRKQKLTPEQEKIRLRGLRILALVALAEQVPGGLDILMGRDLGVMAGDRA